LVTPNTKNDGEAIKTATDALMSTSQEFAQKLYEQAAADGGDAGAATDAGASGADDDEVVDAEIVDDDEETA
jgi:molecular chaperone DnaK